MHLRMMTTAIASRGTAEVDRTVRPRHVGKASMRVLVVEDDEDLATAISQALEDEGFATSIARDGHEALSRLRRGIRDDPASLPDVILLDLMMPNMDGFGFRKRQLEEP